MRKDNECFEIIEQHALGWLFEKTVERIGTVLRSAVGVRDEGLQSNHVLEITSAGEYVLVPYHQSFGRIGGGSFCIGMFISFPIDSVGNEHTILHSYDNFKLCERLGDIYFELYDGGETRSVNTGSSAINFNNGQTYLVIVYRRKGKTLDTLGIDIVDEFYITSNTYVSDLSAQEDLYIGREDDGDYPLYSGTKISGLFIMKGIMSREEEYDYYLKGALKKKIQLFLKLDENSGYIAFDSSLYENHAIIYNYTEDCRIEDDNFFSWQNYYGYSTGTWLSGKGVSTVEIDGIVENINASALIPCASKQNTDAFGKELEYGGRVRYNVEICDILTFKANGNTWGTVVNPGRYHFRPGQDLFSIWFSVEYISGIDMIVCMCGDRYRVEILNDALRVSIGDLYEEFDISVGDAKYLVEVGLVECNVYRENVLLGTFEIGTMYSSGGNFSILSDNGSSVAIDGTFNFLALLKRSVTEEERTSWFISVALPLGFEGAWYFYTKTDRIFDLTLYRNDITLQGYSDTVWQGRQSSVPYLCKGFTEIFINRELQDISIIVPYSLDGRKITYNAYGDNQYEVEYKSRGGQLIFDAYVNFNPGNKKLGFWSEFWDKSNTEVWGNLNGNYLQDNTWKWNLNELSMIYLLSALTEDYYNFAFTGVLYRNWSIVEIVDLVLFNLGNNFKHKEIPI